MAKIKQLKDISGEAISPLTDEKSVYDAAGTRLDVKLNAAVYVNGEAVDTTPPPTVTVDRAVADEDGNNIKNTYATKSELIEATPIIGENGNWVVGGVDTGKSSKGADGKDGADGVSLGEIALVQELSTESGSENKVVSQKVVSEEIEKIYEIGLTNNIIANKIVLGLETNFDFDSATLKLVNRNIETQYASQLVQLSVMIGDEKKQFTYSKNTGSVSNENEIINIKKEELFINVRLSWKGILFEDSSDSIIINKDKVNIIPNEIYENLKSIFNLQSNKMDKSELYTSYILNEIIDNTRGCFIEDNSISLGGEDNWNFFTTNEDVNNLSVYSGSGKPYLVFAENSKCYYILDIATTLKGRIFRLCKDSISTIGKEVGRIEGFNTVNPGEKSYTIKRINYRYIEIYYQNHTGITGEGLLIKFDTADLADILSVDTKIKLGIGVLLTTATLQNVRIERNISINNKEEQKTIGYTRLSNDDIDPISKGSYFIEGDSVKNDIALSTDSYMLLKEDITAIEFTLQTLWDVNFIALCLGHGVDGDVPCFASMQLPTETRNDALGAIKNIGTENQQRGSAVGGGRFSAPYRHPQNYFYNVKKGDRCMIEIVNDQYVCGYVWLNNKWDRWFIIDTKGYWLNADNTYSGALRFGWNERIGIGICGYYGTAAANTTFLSDVKVLSRKNTYLYDLHETNMQRNKLRKNWVALGDSITAIDRNNGLSYVGFANRKLNFNVDNRGKSGWLIVEMWQKRAEVGWEDSISALSDNDVVTILMGTNDWYFNQNGKNYTLGNSESTAEDAKDENTTLGALRLIIERILELKPTVKLYLFTPFYRTKGEGELEEGQFPVVLVNKEGKTIYDYAEAIFNVAKEYNLPAFNLAKDSGICQSTIESYTYDNLHLNENGGKLIGEIISKILI